MASKQSIQLVLLHTNDIHGRHRPVEVSPGSATSQTGDTGQTVYEFDHDGRAGGFAALATAVQRIRRQHGAENVILMDGGDTFSDDLLGNLTEGEAVIRLMNEVGYQFMALGNHDFDYGTPRTRELQEIARFPMRAANVLERETGEPFLGDPTLVLEAGGLRIGLLALGYTNTPLTGNPKNIEPLEFVDGVEVARRHVSELRQKADVVVVLSHQGTAMDEVLAEEVQEIDLIIGAHSHDWIPSTRFGRVWMVQAASDATVLGRTMLTIEDGRVTDVSSEIDVLWLEEYPEDERVAQRVAELRAPYRERLEEVIATAAEPIGRNYKSESPFDRLAGEIMRRRTGAAVSFMPGVGYGVTLRPGPITREALYTMIPHPAPLVTLEMSGEQIVSTLEQTATNLKPKSSREVVGGLVQTSGVRYTLDLTQPLGQRVRDVSIGDEPIDGERAYPVVTNGGLLNGIHHYTAFAEGRNIDRTEMIVTEVVEEGLRQMGTVHAPAMGEVTLVRES